MKFANITYKDETPRSANKFGMYQKLMVPGTFDLTFSAQGYKSQTISVTVEDKGVTVQDVQLEPKSLLDFDEE